MLAHTSTYTFETLVHIHILRIAAYDLELFRWIFLIITFLEMVRVTYIYVMCNYPSKR